MCWVSVKRGHLFGSAWSLQTSKRKRWGSSPWTTGSDAARGIRWPRKIRRNRVRKTRWLQSPTTSGLSSLWRWEGEVGWCRGSGRGSMKGSGSPKRPGCCGPNQPRRRRSIGPEDSPFLSNRFFWESATRGP